MATEYEAARDAAIEAVNRLVELSDIVTARLDIEECFYDDAQPRLMKRLRPSVDPNRPTCVHYLGKIV